MNKSPFRGNILVVQANNILYERCTGFADYANKKRNTNETRFASASAGKAFVAVAILQLIEAGKLKMEDTLWQVLAMDLKAIDPHVTIRQLLNHTSGVPDYFDESVLDDYEALWTDYPNYKIRSNQDLIPLFINEPMMYPPGEKFQYNNTGYVLLALIIEKITGMAFDQYLQQQVFDVSGMSSTGYFELDKLPARCAHNYIDCRASNDFRTNIFSVDAKGTGAGGAFITVGDIVRFWKALTNGQLLSRSMFETITSPQSGDMASTERYGYGFWIHTSIDGQNIPYFQGSDPGVSFLSVYNPQHDVISVIVSNYGDDVDREMDKLTRMFPLL